MAEAVTDTVEEAVDEAREKVGGDRNGQLGKKLLVPAVTGLGTLAVTYAARKAPDIVRDRIKPKVEREGEEEVAKVGKRAAKRLEDRGGPMAKLVGKAADQFDRGGRTKTRRLPIQRWTDVAVPIDVAYERWTEFEDFPKFMHRVLNVERKERDKIRWQEKIWFSTREWEGQITQRRKNDRIAWKTTTGTSHSGIVSFHKLDTNLTRVMVDMDFRPSGMVEKMASGLRFVKRAVEADLARFKAYVEMGEAKGIDYAAETDEGADESRETADTESAREREPARQSS